MPDKSTLMAQFMTDPWKARFMQLAGYTPSQVGITTEAEAQKHLLMLQQMRSAQSGGSMPSSADSSGIGTRNEGIFPVR